MLKEVTINEWNEVIVEINASIFNQSEYLETVAKLHSTTIKYWVVCKNKKPIIGFATHIKRQSIIVPDHFSYSSFWIGIELGNFSFYNYLDQAIIELKKKYRFITFRLPPQINDVRAFNLNGFSTKVSYTYQNKTNQYEYRKDIQLKLLKASEYKMSFFINEDYEEILFQQIRDFKYFGFSKKQIYFYKGYFETLIKKGFLKGFSVKVDEKIVSSSLVIYDINQSKAYHILSSNAKQNYSIGEGTFLFDQMLKSLNNQEIAFFDLYGANMKGIANFKSGFNGNLNPHYTVSYNFYHNFFINIVQIIKCHIKKLL